MDKKTQRIWRRRFAVIGLRFAWGILTRLPLKATSSFGAFVGRLVYSGFLKERVLALRGLAVAFPEKTYAERKAIAKDFFRLMGRSPFETFWLARHPERARRLIRFKGREHLDQALQAGRGVVLVTIHAPHFPLLHLKLAQEKYPIHVMMRPMRDPGVSDYIRGVAALSGIATFLSRPVSAAVRRTFGLLKQNAVVVIQMDQDVRAAGVPVMFFGQSASTPSGPAGFVRRTGAALVPAFIRREEKGTFTVEVLPALPLIEADDEAASVQALTQSITRTFEEWIRQNPRQWSWNHARWGTHQTL
jgi:KDO2-lipid IV(A) lauroyltransferase